MASTARDSSTPNTADANSVKSQLEEMVSELERFDQSASDEIARLSKEPVKGEFETTEQFNISKNKQFETLQKRQDELRADRQVLFTRLMKGAGSLMQEEFREPADFSLGTYNADAQTFPLNKKAYQGIGNLFVPLAEAPELKAHFDEAKGFTNYSLYVDFSGSVRQLINGAGVEFRGRSYHTLPEPMNVDFAMKLLYPGYSSGTTRALVRFNRMEQDYSNWAEGDNVFAKAFFSRAYKEAGKDRFIVLTAASPEENGCHACSVIVGVAIFVKDQPGWKVDLAHKSIGNYFSWGQTAKPKLEKMGPDKYGVVFEWGDMHQGWSQAYAEILTSVDHVFRKVCDFIMSEDNASGMHQREDYVAIRARYGFVPRPNADLYDIRVVYAGRKAVGNGSSAIVRPFSKTVVYQFKDNEYLTSDRYVSPAEKYR